uniref:Putative secreted peptide n=1 Tax=Anopheles braziliensis TaxID=58242 RepID=A0A2M3ZSH3_9DIPT
MELRCRSSSGMILLLLLFDSSGRCSSCLLRIASGCCGGVLPSASGPPSAPGPRLGCGIPTGIGGAPCAPGICCACICCSKRGKSGRCCCPMTAFSSDMVICFARSTAVSTCCWCSWERNGTICVMMALSLFEISVCLCISTLRP